MDLPIPVDRNRLADWRQRWKVAGLAVFGSLLRPDFGPSSDVDLLITFDPNATWSLIDHERMEQELTEIVGRKVDLVSRAGLEQSANWIRREMILSTAEPIDVEG
jgi:predicted nucleotidyltransferase